MQTSHRSHPARSLLLGIAGGMRSMMPLAAVALAVGSSDAPRVRRSVPVLRHRWARIGVLTMAAAELVGDKLPTTPSRLMLPALAGRLVASAVGGAALHVAGGRSGRATGAAVFAAAGAMVGALGGYWGRRAIGEATGVPDPAVAVLEDAAAITLARAAARW